MKDTQSGKNRCPAVYLDEEGMLVIQGGALDAASWANVLVDEGAVRIKPEIVRDALARLPA